MIDTTVWRGGGVVGPRKNWNISEIMYQVSVSNKSNYTLPAIIQFKGIVLRGGYRIWERGVPGNC